MSGIPEEIMKEAEKAFKYGFGLRWDVAVETIAKAILAERDRCAIIAICHSDDRPRRDGLDWNDGYIDGCRGAHDAILAPSQPK